MSQYLTHHSLISLTHHCYNLNPGSRCGWTCNQLTSKVDGGITGSQFRWSTLTYVRPHNPATGCWPPTEPFSHRTGTLRCLQKEMATYTHWSVSLWRDPDDVSHCRILSPDKTEWQFISTTLCGWRCCFVADQLWFMTCIREEEEDSPPLPQLLLLLIPHCTHTWGQWRNFKITNMAAYFPTRIDCLHLSQGIHCVHKKSQRIIWHNFS